MDPILSLAGKPDKLLYGLAKDQFLYNRQSVVSYGQVWVLYNDKVVFCDLSRNVGLTPVESTEQDRKALISILETHYVSQSFERLVENIISWGCLPEDDAPASGSALKHRGQDDARRQGGQ